MKITTQHQENKPVPLKTDSFNWLTAPDIKTWLEEKDACALVASIRKNGVATHGNLKRVLAALGIMGHRAGEVNGEGDGCGVMTDIPRLLWSQALEQEGKPGWLAEDRRFFVGHLMIPNTEQNVSGVQQIIIKMLMDKDIDLLLERPIQTRPQALGKMTRLQTPYLWQIAGMVRKGPLENVERTLFDLALEIEKVANVSIASLSSYVVIHKVRGSTEVLYQYYPELRNPDFTTAITIGHARYSTNTATSFERVQPFSLLGHNGEINTIARLREQAELINVELTQGGSDSQDLDRLLATLIHKYHFTLTEAMELAFPPILSEVEKFPPDLQSIYKYYRQSFGPFSQGPAGIISRYGDECLFSVDALGLRPLWFGETEKEFFFSSEKGVYHLDTVLTDPIPLSPGEKMRVRIHRGRNVEVFDYSAIQQRMLKLTLRRFGSIETINNHLAVSADSTAEIETASSSPLIDPQIENRMAAFGWGREDQQWVQELANPGSDPITSLGYDGPLAALSSERQNIADYFKEAVAVVTNPAIDREREVEHFSTQSIIGARPPLTPGELRQKKSLALQSPIVTDPAQLTKVYDENQVAYLQLTTQPEETTAQGLERLARSAIDLVKSGTRILVLDDSDAFDQGNGWIDPILTLSILDRALRKSFIELDQTDASTPLPIGDDRKIDLGLTASRFPQNLRRQAGLILRRGAIRNLHDIMMCIGMGADVIIPYMIFEAAIRTPCSSITTEERLQNTLKALRTGVEKSISTMGIHEARGYGRLFASIGISSEVASALGSVNYAGSDQGGLRWSDLDADMVVRSAIFNGQTRGDLSKVNHYYPKIWKAAGQLGKGEADWHTYEEYTETIAKNNGSPVINGKSRKDVLPSE